MMMIFGEWSATMHGNKSVISHNDYSKNKIIFFIALNLSLAIYSIFA